MKLTLMTLVLVALIGCSSSRPSGNSEFAEVSNIKALDGTYQNLGETGNTVRWYLSALIWPHDTALDHPFIASIEVHALGDDSLRVKAFDSHGVKKEQIFVEGRDFEFKSGRLRIKHHVGFHTPGEEGDVLVGLMTESLEMGVDEKGQGKSKSSETFVGLVYLVMPMAATDTVEVRFVKIGK